MKWRRSPEKSDHSATQRHLGAILASPVGRPLVKPREHHHSHVSQARGLCHVDDHTPSGDPRPSRSRTGRAGHRAVGRSLAAQGATVTGGHSLRRRWRLHPRLTPVATVLFILAGFIGLGLVLAPRHQSTTTAGWNTPATTPDPAADVGSTPPPGTWATPPVSQAAPPAPGATPPASLAPLARPAPRHSSSPAVSATGRDGSAPTLGHRHHPSRATSSPTQRGRSRPQHPDQPAGASRATRHARPTHPVEPAPARRPVTERPDGTTTHRRPRHQPSDHTRTGLASLLPGL